MTDFTLREAEPNDAPRILRYMQRLLSEPDHNLRRDADEFRTTVGEEIRIIRDYRATPNSLFLIAKAGEEIVGVLTCTGSKFRAERHTTELGISVDQEWRGKGIGSAMLGYAIDWARNTAQLVRISLFVMERNKGAIQLYQRYGFEIEGRLRKDFYRSGQYMDTLIMGLLL